MKKQIIIASIACALSVSAAAQLSTDSIRQQNTRTVKTEAGSLLATLAGALNADSYESAYAREKQGFIKRVKSANSGKAVAGYTAEFIKYIKPAKFKKEVNIQELVAATQSVTTFKQSADVLKRIESALKPDAISSMWSMSRESWLNEVKQVGR